jgi:hypothetical protein
LESANKQLKVVNSILANIQMYVKKSQAAEKIEATSQHVSALSEDMLNLVLEVQKDLRKLEGIKEADLNKINKHLNTIVEEKAQNFDIVIQKLSQVKELVTNIKLGLSGRRMQQIEGDKYLFSKDRKQI